jgi:hypothetical protein
MAIADGYLAYLNVYDMQIYVVGRGPSTTTVTASPKIVTENGAVLIEGTVMDTTPAGKVIPAVSDDSMTSWMAYEYMQKPIPNVKGVEVKLTAIDSNGNPHDIGKVTSDMTGMFKKMWTPPVTGEYTIIASFEGTKGYYPSYAETAVGVSTAQATAAPTATPTPTPTIAPTATPSPTASPSIVSPPPGNGWGTEYYVAIAAVVIIIAIAAIALVLRKRK